MEQSPTEISGDDKELHVGLEVPNHVAHKIHHWAQQQDWPEGTDLESPSDYHITLMFTPSGHDEHKDAWWIEHLEQSQVQVTGVGVFPAADKGGYAYVLKLNAPEIKEHAEKMQGWAERHGLEITHFPGGYQPHITVAYGPTDRVNVMTPTWEFDVGPSSVSSPRIKDEDDPAWEGVDKTAGDAQMLDNLSMTSIAHNLHYRYGEGLDASGAVEYAQRLLKMIGYPTDKITTQAAIQAWQALYPQDSVLEDATTSRHIAAADQLDWTPGNHGKGSIHPNLAVKTWNTDRQHGEPSHAWSTWPYNGVEEFNAMRHFEIDPDGKVSPAFYQPGYHSIPLSIAEKAIGRQLQPDESTESHSTVPTPQDAWPEHGDLPPNEQRHHEVQFSNDFYGRVADVTWQEPVDWRAENPNLGYEGVPELNDLDPLADWSPPSSELRALEANPGNSNPWGVSLERTPGDIAAIQHTGQIPGDENFAGPPDIYHFNRLSGVNPSFLGSVNGRGVFVKSTSGFHTNDLPAERAAFAVAHHLGIPMPHTVAQDAVMPRSVANNPEFTRWITKQVMDDDAHARFVDRLTKPHPAQVQEAIPGDTALRRYGKGDNFLIAHPHEARRIGLLDHVIGNNDRHLGNVLIDHGNNIYPIDHGGAFTTGSFYPAYDWVSDDPYLTPEEMERLRHIQNLDFEGMGVDPEAAYMTRRRITRMLEAGRANASNPYYYSDS